MPLQPLRAPEVPSRPSRLSLLLSGQIDLAIVAYDDPVGDITDDLERTHVLTDPFRVIVPRDHRLAGRRTIALTILPTTRKSPRWSERCRSQHDPSPRAPPERRALPCD